MMNSRRINTFTFLFFAFMLFITLFSEDLHHMALPKVKTAVAMSKEFPFTFTNENGDLVNTTLVMKAVPKIALYNNSVYTLEEREDGIYIVSTPVVIGGEKDGWINIEEGISKGIKVVIGSDRELVSGMRVLEVQEDE